MTSKHMEMDHLLEKMSFQKEKPEKKKKKWGVFIAAV